MIRDAPRDMLPPGAAHNMVDWIPLESGAALAKRGGWSYVTTTPPTLPTNPDRVIAVGYGNVTGGDIVIGIARDNGSGNNRLFVVTSGGGTSDVAATNFVDEPLTYYRRNFIITGRDGTSTPQRFNGSQIVNLGGSPPTGRRSCIYKDRVVLANSGSNSNRIWFSGAGNFDSWNTSTSWIDAEYPVTALYPLRNAILVFHEFKLNRIIGSIPPPGSDMQLQPLWDQGTYLTFANSLAGNDEYCVFANALGVYMTDGTTVVDLARQGGMKSYWSSLFGGTARRVHGGVFRDYYVCNVTTDGNPPAFIDAFLVHIPSRRWFRISNLTAESFWHRVSKDKEELYWGDFSEPRINSLSSIFSASSSTKEDADGTDVQPVLETQFVRLGHSRGRIKSVYTRYYLRDAGSDNPTITVSAIYSPESSQYTTIDTLAETGTETLARSSCNKAAYGFALKYTQSGNSAITHLRGVAVAAHPREDSRLS
jgi:hypothetical protein